MLFLKREIYENKQGHQEPHHWHSQAAGSRQIGWSPLPGARYQSVHPLPVENEVLRNGCWPAEAAQGIGVRISTVQTHCSRTDATDHNAQGCC